MNFPGSHSKASIVSSAVEALGLWCTAIALLVLPFQGWAGHSFSWWGLLPFDALVAWALVLSLPRMLSMARHWWGVRASAACLALALAGLISESLQPSAAGLLQRLLVQAAPVAVVWLVASHGSRPKGLPLMTCSLVVGGLGAAGLGLVGWIVDLGWGHSLATFRSAHPLFDGLSRWAGTTNKSPQRAGNLLVLLGAALWAVGPLKRRRNVLAQRGAWLLCGSCLVLTLSFAWAGGAVLTAGAVRVAPATPRLLRRFVFGAVALSVIVASYSMSVGVVSDARTGPCNSLDAEHYVVVMNRASRDCTRLSRAGRAVTTYTEAKRLSLNAIAEHPWIGVGFRGFEHYATQQFEEEHGTLGSFYHQPHGIYHGLAAKHGLLGWLAVLVAWGALIKGWRSTPWDWLVAAFLVIGLHFDVDRLRELWVAWGMLAAQQLNQLGQGAACRFIAALVSNETSTPASRSASHSST